MVQQASSLDCDVVIVNYNSGALLTDCVTSVLKAGAAHAIIVDNASNDTSLNCLERAYQADARIIIIRNHANLGFAKACNIGAQVSSAPYILFLNPDTTIEESTINRMIEVIDSEHDIGMVGGMLCNMDGTEQPGGRRVFPTPRRAFIRAFGLSQLGRYFPTLFSDFLLHKEPLPTEPVRVEAISGACMLVSRETLEDVGPLDEGYYMHCEDLDWCMRYWQKGWQVFFVPDAKIYHVWGGCSRSRPIFVEWHKHKGMMRFYRKFFHHQYPGILMWLVGLGVWLRFGLIAIYYSARHVARWLGLLRA